MYTLLLIVNIVVALVMVGIILLQHGQGAEAGSSFGRGNQGSLIGVTGSANVLSRATSVLATVFFVTALALGLVVKQQNADPALEDILSEVEASQPEAGDVPQVEDVPQLGDDAAAAGDAPVPDAGQQADN